MYVFATRGRIFKTITKAKLDDVMKEVGVGDMEKIYNITIFFFYITIHDFITILCHAGFTFLLIFYFLVQYMYLAGAFKKLNEQM